MNNSEILLAITLKAMNTFKLDFYYGFTYEEIAQQEQVNKSTVRQSVRKVLESIETMNIL